MADKVKQIVETKPTSNIDFDLPDTLTTPEINMESCILFGLPKCGKTTLLSKLPNCLIIDTETASKEDPIDELAAAEDEALDTEDDGNFSESDNFEASEEDGDDASEADDENSDKDPA